MNGSPLPPAAPPPDGPASGAAAPSPGAPAPAAAPPLPGTPPFGSVAPRAAGGWSAGVLAAAVGLLVLLAGQAIAGAPGLLEVVAGGVTRLIPIAWFEAGLAAFGSLAKGLLFAGVCLGALGAGALVGRVVAGSGPDRSVGVGGDVARGLGIGAAVLVLAELAVLPLADAGFLGLGLQSSWAALQMPLVIACTAYGLVLAGLLRAAVEPGPKEPGPEEPAARTPAAPAGAAPGPAATGPAGAPGVAAGRPQGTSRRGFLGRSLALSGIVALGISGLIVAARAIGTTRMGAGGTANGDTGGTTADGFAVEVVEPVTTASGSVVGSSAAGYFGPTAAATPMERFYVVAKDLVPPDVDPDAWRLSVTGLVGRELSLTLAELRAMPPVESFRTLQCISAQVTRWDRYIGNQRWQGVRVRDLLEQAVPRPEARHVLWRSADGYTESLPLEIARDADTLLAYEMGSAGTLLPREHGGPLRVLIAGRYGMKQPKWVEAVTLSATNEPGYWQRRGWDDQAVVRTYSRIDWPRNGASVPAGSPFPVYGVANAGDRGVRRVEVSLDGSSWVAAELEPVEGAIGPSTWRRWRVELRAPSAGPLTLRARATDGLDQVQDPEPRPPLPSGATGLHAVALLAEAGVDAPLPANHPEA